MMDHDSETVLLVLPWSPTHQGGVTGVVQNLVAHWGAESSIRPRLVVNDWLYAQPREINGIPHMRMSAFGQLTYWGLLKSAIRAPVLLARLAMALRRWHVVAVNFHYPGVGPSGVAILKKLGIFKGRLVLSYHGTDVRPPANPCERWVQSLCLQAADAVVVCSRSLGARLSQTFAPDANRPLTIYNGVDGSIFKHQVEASGGLHLEIPRPYILSVGSYISRKAHDIALSAFSRVVQTQPGLHFCIAGATGDRYEATRQFVVEHGLADRVTLLTDLGPKDIAALLSQASLVIQTSRAESFPLSLLEAGAVGVPIVASNIPGHNELIVEGETGRLFQDGDSQACARAIEAALTDRETSYSMATVLREKVLSELTWEKCVEEYKLCMLP